MKTILLALLVLPMAVAAHIPNTIGTNRACTIPDDNIIIELASESGIISVTGQNKTRIEIFDASWQLLITETNCTPLTVYVDISGQPDGDYWVKVTTTTGTVTEMVTKG